jgi:hypothetical protein
MGTRKKALVSEDEVRGEVDALLSAMGVGPSGTLDEDENAFDGAPARDRVKTGEITTETAAPSADADALWGSPTRKRR